MWCLHGQAVAGNSINIIIIIIIIVVVVVKLFINVLKHPQGQ
jgi:hypothetical protein